MAAELEEKYNSRQIEWLAIHAVRVERRYNNLIPAGIRDNCFEALTIFRRRLLVRDDLQKISTQF